MNSLWLAVVGGWLALLFAGYLATYIRRQDPGNTQVREITHSIRIGAMAFLRREYQALGIFAIVVGVILAIFVAPGPWTGLAYVAGVAASALAGWFGMNIATMANGRTAHAAIGSYARALRIAFSGGAVMGFTVLGLGLFPVALLPLFTVNDHVWLAYAFGASSVALFLRAGGGIFTKSADVGADLVGKVEAGIPEDDPRNPAVIADNVGDNVGDVAGMGSDLYESYVSALIASMVLGFLLFPGEAKGYLLPLFLGGAGVVASIIGALFVRPPEVRGSFEEQTHKAASAMNRGVYVSGVLILAMSYFVTNYFLGGSNSLSSSFAVDDGMKVFIALAVGLVAGFLLGKSTEYFTSDYAPVKGIAKASLTGPATTIIEGLSVGMMSTVIPIILVAAATVVAFQAAGFFGIAIAALGMLVTLGMLLAIDCYGPIADNAAGISEMAGLGKEVRERTEALDAVGNTTAAIGKGFAIASAALAALAWIATYLVVAGIPEVDGERMINIMDANVVAGLLVGGMICFVFAALAMKAVGGGAAAVVEEVRRQFREIKGLMEGTAKPDYVKCVDIATKKALWGMMGPGLIALATPLILGFTLGKEAVAGMLVGALLSGFLLAIFMANAGGAWDNAKKYIESGQLGGKGSDAHKAAVIGDTVGDPFKDTAGPSLNILIKVVGKVAVIFGPFFLM
ncbi:MAG: sodium-translocating pyrophosphatase [Dehalococcoidia bacterium]